MCRLMCAMAQVWKSEDNFGRSVLPFYSVGPGMNAGCQAWQPAPLAIGNLTAQGFYFIFIVNDIFETCDLISPNAKLIFLLSEAFTGWVLAILTSGKSLLQKITALEIFLLTHILSIKLILVGR